MNVKKLNKTLLTVAAILIVVMLIVNVLLVNNKDTISIYLGGYSGAGADTSVDANNVYKDNRALNEKLGEESTVLLKNDRNTLPLAKNTKVTFFGSMSYNYIISGNGSGSGADDDNTLMMNEAFKNAGLDVNETAWKALEEAAGGSRGSSNPKYSINAKNDWASYTDNLEFSGDNYREFMTDSVLSGYTNGYAIVTIARNGAEGAAPSFDMDGEFDSTGNFYTRSYLELTPNEKEMLSFVASKFDKVIILVNSAAPMELGFIDLSKYNIDAAVWMGYPGENGIQGVADCFTNKDGANPSGRLADIWSYDLTTNPTYYNSGYNKYTNYNIAGVTIEDDPNGQGIGLVAGYLDYEEGIYIGYRYYETADELGYFDSKQFTSHTFKGNVKDTDGKYDSDYSGSAYESSVYDGAYGRVVQFAFGYGLSYTTFSQTIVEKNIKLTAHGSNSVTVNVKNTGDTYSGKTVIQLYMDAPTQQDNTLGIKGYGLEKATRTLVAFQKTDNLAPGEDKDYTLTFETDDLASFDYAGQNAYVLEKGSYTFELCEDSHTVLTKTDPVLLESTYVYNDDGVGKRDSDEVVATNQMDDVTAADGRLDAGPGGYMSRYEGVDSGFEYAWDHIWDKAPYRSNESMPEEALKVASLNGGEEYNHTFTAYKKGEAYTKTMTFYAKGATQQSYMKTNHLGYDMNDERYRVTWGSTETDYTVFSRFDTFTHEYVCEYDELGADEFTDYNTTNTVGFADLDYDDPLWDTLLNQVTLDEAVEMNGNSGWGIPAMESVGKPYVQWIDGPGESGNGSFDNGVCWVCEVNLSATFNPDLIEEMGVGYGNESQIHGTSGAYAPAMNAHRSPFEGRFFEYFAEDPLLSGKIGAAEVRGIQSTGTAVTIKHYALNDDCSTSPGAFTWVNEQAGRELYYKPYELCIKEADARGIMTSVVRVGFSSSNHYGLYINITRNEWGFRGYAITDGYTQTAGDFLGANGNLFGGLIGNLSRGSYITDSACTEELGMNATETLYGQYLLREQVHGMLWQYVGTSGVSGTLATWWIPVWVVADILLAAGIVLCIVFGIYPIFKKEED